LISTGRPTVLLFVSPGCAPCSAIVPDVEQWQQRFANTINFAFISSSDREANIEKFGKVPVPVALQADREVAVSYGAEATPTGILIDRDGRMRARPAVGQTAIRELVSRSISSELDATAEGRTPAPVQPVEEDSIASLLAAPGSNQVGTYGSRMPLPTLEGGYLALDEVAGGSPILLFWNTECTFCQGIVEDIREWESEAGDQASRLLIYAQGSETDLRKQEFTSRVILDPGFTIAHSFGATGTPSAALLDESNRLAQPVAVGGDNVLDLLFDQIEPLTDLAEDESQPLTSVKA
jgi:thiol-disulfide isomerase/thioredoxin